MTEPRRPAEMAHVLFMDLAGYSLLSMEEQARMVIRLQDVVRNTDEFRRAEASGDLISVPTGDGLALVFFRDPIGPVQCAVEIAHSAIEHPRLRIRMGVHSGPVSRVEDLQGRENVAGSGINTAQRVMDCAEEGQILLSSSSAAVVSEFESWTDYIHDLGECLVKHGLKLHLYNLHGAGFGVAALPTRMIAGRSATEDAPRQAAASPNFGTAPAANIPAASLPSPTVPAANAEGQENRLAVLYKRGAQPDEGLLAFLEKTLQDRGFTIFIDRHLSIGVEWAQEIERQLRAADAVILLVSDAAMGSEMLEYEIRTAHEAAHANGGKPRLLPVRVGFTGKLPDSLAPILDPLNYFLWNGAQDNARLASELETALRSPPKPVAVRLERSGGAVPLDSTFYIERPTDSLFREAMAEGDSIVLVKGARQMGKTSLLARGLEQAREAGARVVMTDMQSLNLTHLESLDALYLTFAEILADELDLDVDPHEHWSDRRGPNMNLDRFIRRQVLEVVPQRVVWGLDEVDRLFGCSFGSEVFGLFRSWHNRRTLDPTGPWNRLTLAIAYALEAHLFISDLNQSPFNVGTRLALAEFTPEQVGELNRRCGSPLRTREDLERFYELISGHPGLVRRGLDEMVTAEISLDCLVAGADREEGPFGDHLRRLLMALSQDPVMLEAMKSVLLGRGCPSTETFYRLRSSGVTTGESAEEARPRCQLYSTYLSRHLIASSVP